MGNEKDDLNREFLSFGFALEKEFLKSREPIRQELKARQPLLSGALKVIASAFGSIHTRGAVEVQSEEAAKRKLQRAAIHASTMHGLEVIEFAISSAAYVQTATLVRQEMEALTLCVECRQSDSNPMNGKNPKLHKALKFLGRDYGMLSQLAHNSSFEWLNEVIDVSTNGIDVVLNPRFEERLLCIHLVCLVGLAFDAANLRPFSETSFLSDQEMNWLSAVVGALNEYGFLRVDTPSA